MTTPSRNTCETYVSGNLPPWELVNLVRSGGTRYGYGTGPPPFKSFPWQTAQFCLYNSAPETECEVVSDCIDFKYFARLSSRTLPKSRSSSTQWKTGPQIGISLDPCEANTSSPAISSSTKADGNCPPLFCASRVKSGTFAFRACAAGPSPLPLKPWQGAQYAR